MRDLLLLENKPMGLCWYKSNKYGILQHYKLIDNC